MNLSKEKNYKKILPGIILAAACCFMVLFYAPLELYFNNKNEFWFDFYTMIPVLLTMFLVTAVLSGAVFYSVLSE